MLKYFNLVSIIFHLQLCCGQLSDGGISNFKFRKKDPVLITSDALDMKSFKDESGNLLAFGYRLPEKSYAIFKLPPPETGNERVKKKRKIQQQLSENHNRARKIVPSLLSPTPSLAQDSHLATRGKKEIFANHLGEEMTTKLTDKKRKIDENFEMVLKSTHHKEPLLREDKKLENNLKKEHGTKKFVRKLRNKKNFQPPKNEMKFTEKSQSLDKEKEISPYKVSIDQKLGPVKSNSSRTNVASEQLGTYFPKVPLKETEEANRDTPILEPTRVSKVKNLQDDFTSGDSVYEPFHKSDFDKVPEASDANSDPQWATPASIVSPFSSFSQLEFDPEPTVWVVVDDGSEAEDVDLGFENSGQSFIPSQNFENLNPVTDFRPTVTISEGENILLPQPLIQSRKLTDETENVTEKSVETNETSPCIIQSNWNELKTNFPKCRKFIESKSCSFSNFGLCLLQVYPTTRELSLSHTLTAGGGSVQFDNDESCTEFVHLFFPRCQSYIPSCKQVQSDKAQGVLVLGCLFGHYTNLMMPLLQIGHLPR